MPSTNPPPPTKFSKAFHWCFQRYLERSLPKNFHTLSLLDGCPGVPPADEPVIVALNHPSWWDPLIGLYLAERCFPGHQFAAPIQADMLAKYRIFERLGFYGVDKHSTAGLRTFLSTSRAILNQQGGSIWLTPEGRFADPRDEPPLEPGLAHLLSRCDRGSVFPLAAEYPFWEERLPEALAHFGPPINIADHAGLSKDGWQALVTDALRQSQTRLAKASIARDVTRFRPMFHGRTGAGRFYDVGRRLMCRLRGETLQLDHSNKLNVEQTQDKSSDREATE